MLYYRFSVLSCLHGHEDSDTILSLFVFRVGVGTHDRIIYVSILATVCKGVGDPVAALDCALVRVGDAEGTCLHRTQ